MATAKLGGEKPPVILEMSHSEAREFFDWFKELDGSGSGAPFEVYMALYRLLGD